MVNAETVVVKKYLIQVRIRSLARESSATTLVEPLIPGLSDVYLCRARSSKRMNHVIFAI